MPIVWTRLSLNGRSTHTHAHIARREYSVSYTNTLRVNKIEPFWNKKKKIGSRVRRRFLYLPVVDVSPMTTTSFYSGSQVVINERPFRPLSFFQIINRWAKNAENAAVLACVSVSRRNKIFARRHLWLVIGVSFTPSTDK